MKHFFLSLVLTLCLSVAYSQSNVAYIYSSEVFNKSIRYVEVKQEIDTYVKTNQEKIDSNLKQAKVLFEIYNKSTSPRNSTEMQEVKKTIISIEKSANELQERIFGKDGELQKLQKKLMDPIEKMVVLAVDGVAQKRGYDMVFDLSIVKNTIYQSQKVNITEEVIEQIRLIENNVKEITN